MKRTPRKQGTHDARVRQVAKGLKKEGWNVKSDLPGYEKPSPIGQDSRIPDIEATKRGHRKLVEAETPDSLEKDKAQ